MPPKAKFTKDEIVRAAFDMVREDGVDILTARALGQKLGSSSRPIFTVFQSMEEVKQEVIREARRLYGTYVERGLSQIPAFKGVGTQYILFALEEPKLFQLLFMAEQRQVPKLSEVLPMIEENYEKILCSIQKDYGIKAEDAERLYRPLWIYTHGIAALCATRMCAFTGEEISIMMTEVCSSLLRTYGSR